MRKHANLLLLVLVLLLVAVLAVSCGGGEDDTTEAPEATTAPSGTTAADVTTEAAVTTTLSGDKEYLTQEELTQAYFDLDGVPYKNGSAIDKNAYAVSKCPGPCEASYTFKKVDAEGNLIQDLGSTVPTEVGYYKVTATFSFKTNRKYENYIGTPLPAPVTGDLEIVAAAAKGFGVQDATIYSYENMEYLPDINAAAGKANIHTGTLPAGVSVKEYKVTKTHDAAGNAITATPMTSITGAGKYTVEVVYQQTGNNWTAASLAGKTANITVVDIAADKQVKRADNIVVDGVLDEAYQYSAKYTGVYQAKNGTVGGLEFPFPEDAASIVNPMENAALYHISKGSEVAENFTTGVEFTMYVAWGQPEGSAHPWIYVAVVVEDETDYQRSARYTAQRNAWINDGIEIYYSFGGYSAPVINKNTAGTSYGDTYPTYKVVTNSSAVRENVTFSAVRAQQSKYYADILFGITRDETVTGNNEGKAVTYISEYAFPAKSESYEGTPGNAYIQYEGDVLKAGELLFFGIQVNDLIYLPEGYDDNVPSTPKYADEWTNTAQGDWVKFEADAQKYICCVGNRNSVYLMNEQGGPMIVQLSSAAAVAPQN